MKKLFTLVALLAVFMGAKAEWVQDYKVDYSTFNGFPFYVMGHVPEWVDGVMTDLGGNFKYGEVKDDAEETSDVIVKTNGNAEYYRLPKTDGTWHQYFIADGIPTELDGAYTVKAMVKASEACSINVNMGWGWNSGQQASATVSIGTDWQEVEWEYTGIGGTSCNLVAQPNTAAQIEWKSLTVGHNAKPQRPTTWQEWLTADGQPVIVEGTNVPGYVGNAETPWTDPNVRFNDQEKNFLVCAWGKEKGVNLNDNGGWDPFPATIEQEDNGNHYYIVHAKLADTEGDASAWDNQFWIQSPKEWKSGTQVKVHFRYKASQNVTTNTQIHKQNPSDYLHYEAVGDVAFTTEWQDFDKTFTFNDSQNGGWSIAFNLNPNVKDPIDFYFDDLSWQTMKLDEGFFVAGSNPSAGIEYDLDNAIEFVLDEDAGVMVATVGEKNAYVSQVMISTVRGNDAAFKGATIKPSRAITYDPEDIQWLDYTDASLAKLNLPGEGIWKIYLNTEYKAVAFELLEGNIIEPKEINPNPTLIVVNGQEREYLSADNDGNAREAEIGTGETWDNQFFIVANRELSTGETTVLQFKYKASVDAKTTTQCHGAPGGYMHYAAIGDVNFATDWQDFETTFTVPSQANGMKTIAFNMAEIKGACKYEIKDVVWKLEDNTESLINQTGSENFYVKEGAGTSPYIFGTDPDGIFDMKAEKVISVEPVNLAGQRVTKSYRGVVLKGKKKFFQ